MSAITFEYPGTQHASISESTANAVRRMMSDGARDVRVPILRNAAADYRAEGASAPVSAISDAVAVFNVKTAAAPAPFVGDPILNLAVYLWRIAVDEYGRWIAGEARLVWQYPA